jgi:hypothetical protein
MRSVILMWLVAAIGLAAPAAGRQIEQWSYERLFKEADVVVIARSEGTAASEDQPAVSPFAAGLTGQRTTFRIESALKGQVEGKQIVVVHFKRKDNVLFANGPLLVGFRTEGPVIEGGGARKYQAKLSRPQYLLFLRKAEGGRFEPVSGQIDPRMSVKEIYDPLPEVIDEVR